MRVSRGTSPTSDEGNFACDIEQGGQLEVLIVVVTGVVGRHAGVCSCGGRELLGELLESGRDVGCCLRNRLH